MSSYVIAGYILTFGVLGLYALRTVVRARHVAASLLEHDRMLGLDADARTGTDGGTGTDTRTGTDTGANSRRAPTSRARP